MNVWFWPFVFEPAQGGHVLGVQLATAGGDQAVPAFYAFTSSWWDIGRAVGTALIIALFGAPVLKLLRRFGSRFTFQTSHQ